MKLKNNWQLKLLSVVLAILIWSSIIGGENPMVGKTLADVPVTIIHKENLNNSGFLVTDEGITHIDVKIRGKRNALVGISSQDISATVDASAFQEGTNTAKISVRVPQDTSLESQSDYSTTVKLEKMISRDMTVTVERSGGMAQDYLFEGSTPSPTKVNILGPRSRVESIDRLVAVINVNTLTKDETLNVPLQVWDKDGNEVPDIRLGQEYVNVSVSVSKTKTVPVIWDKKNETPANIRIVKQMLVPDTIQIKGTAEAVDKVNEILTEPFDLAQLKENVNGPVKLVWPEGIVPVDSSREVILNVSTEKHAEKEYSLKVEDLPMTNLATKYEAKPENSTQEIKLVITGYESDLIDLKLEDLKLHLDLKEAKLGTNEYKIQMELPDKYILKSIEPENITVNVSNKQ